MADLKSDQRNALIWRLLVLASEQNTNPYGRKGVFTLRGHRGGGETDELRPDQGYVPLGLVREEGEPEYIGDYRQPVVVCFVIPWKEGDWAKALQAADIGFRVYLAPDQKFYEDCSSYPRIEDIQVRTAIDVVTRSPDGQEHSQHFELGHRPLGLLFDRNALKELEQYALEAA